MPGANPVVLLSGANPVVLSARGPGHLKFLHISGLSCLAENSFGIKVIFVFFGLVFHMKPEPV
jgi:hypothetical protein